MLRASLIREQRTLKSKNNVKFGASEKAAGRSYFWAACCFVGGENR